VNSKSMSVVAAGGGGGTTALIATSDPPAVALGTDVFLVESPMRRYSDGVIEAAVSGQAAGRPPEAVRRDDQILPLGIAGGRQGSSRVRCRCRQS
jgi:hypothetical protein